MKASRPFETLHLSLSQALERHLSDIIYKRKLWAESKEKGEDVYQSERRRPYLDEVEVDMFVQTWSDTSMGFGGVAGQAFTSAYTVVVTCFDNNEYVVYHGGRFAYLIRYESRSEEGFRKFQEDLTNHNLAGHMDQVRYK